MDAAGLTKENVQRHRYWDILKGLGILAVVVGHSGSPLIPFIYMYHLAFFFFISGCLYKDIYSEDPVIYIAKRTKSLYWPFVKYGVIFLLLHNVFLRLNILSEKTEPGIITTKAFAIPDMIRMAENIVTLITTEQMAGAMWFIPVLFIACILFCIVRYVSIRVAGKRSLMVTGIVSVTLFLVGIILARKNVFLSRHADVALVVLPIVFAGYLFNNSGKRLIQHWGIALCCVFFLVFMSRKYGFIQLDNRVYINPWLFVTASFAGIYINVYLGKVMEETIVPGKFFAYIGRRSLTIMALHFLAFKIVSAVYIATHGVPLYWVAKFPVITGSDGWWIAYTISGIGIPLVFSALSASLAERIRRRRSLAVSA